MFKKMRKMGLIVLLFGAITPACIARDSEVGPTPQLEGYGSTPQGERPLLPENLDCGQFDELEEGSQWGEFQIGESTYDDLLRILKPQRIYWDEFAGNVVFENYPSGVGFYPDPLRACFVGDTLSAIRVFAPDDVQYLEEWIEQYGQPDRVTWANFNTTRTLIWADEGMLIVADACWRLVESVVLFSPIPADELEGSWLMDALPQGPIQVEFDTGEPTEDCPFLTPEQNVEDPWGYNQQ